MDEKEEGQVTGVVREALPSATFRVEIGDEKVIHAYLSGKMRMYRIKVLVGDSVIVKLDPYGSRGRIIKRL